MGIDLSGQVYARFQKAEAQAKHFWEQGRGLEAAAAYRRCADLLRQYAQYGATKQIQQQRLKRSKQYQELADRIEAGAAAAPAAEAGSTADYEAEVLNLIHRSTVTWEDIGGLEETKREIQAAYALALARRPLGVRLGLARNILLYGPPGTGKTLLAAAASNELDATFFNVKVSDMLSKWFGESSKLVSALYRVAEQRAPAVVFLDEFDALTPPRGGSESGAERRILSTFLSELDGLSKKGEAAPYVLTIGATNVPWLVDNAILSRFGAKLIQVPLPDAGARAAILALQLDQAGLQSEVSMEELVARTEGYSGREIAEMCLEAATRMASRANPALLEVADRGRTAIGDYMLRVTSLTAEDFDQALARIRPGTTPADLARLAAWRAAQE
jgi:katanin p60 ATPase-containing subunit A1